MRGKHNFKFGDIILNKGAGKSNPSKYWVYTHSTKDYICGFTIYKYNGRLCKDFDYKMYYANDTIERQEVIGHIDLLGIIENEVNKYEEVEV